MQIVFPLLCQFIPVGSGSSQVHRPAACDCISDDPADQADVYLEDRPEKAKRLCCCSSCATSEILTTEVQDTSMAKRSTENARCNLGCRNPTLTRAAAQQRANKRNTIAKAKAPPLPRLPKGPVRNRRRKERRTNDGRLKHAEAFFARSNAR